MRPGAGKQKGNAFERDVCRSLSTWFSAGQADDWCWRSASSGARGTTSRTKTKGYHGDIVATAPEMEPFFKCFSVEVKHYKDLDITEVLRGYRFVKYSQIIRFWRQTLKSAALSKRHPLLIYKINNIPAIVVCKMALVKHMALTDAGAIKKIPYITLGSKLALFDFTSALESLNVDSFKLWLARYGTTL